jgi:hypothetical protein
MAFFRGAAQSNGGTSLSKGWNRPSPSPARGPSREGYLVRLRAPRPAWVIATGRHLRLRPGGLSRRAGSSPVPSTSFVTSWACPVEPAPGLRSQVVGVRFPDGPLRAPWPRPNARPCGKSRRSAHDSRAHPCSTRGPDVTAANEASTLVVQVQILWAAPTSPHHWTEIWDQRELQIRAARFESSAVRERAPGRSVSVIVSTTGPR